MAININGKPATPSPAPAQAWYRPPLARAPAEATTRKRGAGSAHRKPVSADMLSGPGRLNAGHLLTLLDISSPTLYARIKRGQVPPPEGHDGRGHPYWHAATMRAYLATLNS